MLHKSFKEVESKVLKFYNDKKYEEAANLLESVIEKFPDDLFTIVWDLAIFYLLMSPKEVEKCIDILEYGFNHGLWYSINPKLDLWEPCVDSAKFQELLKQNNARKIEAQAKAKAEYKIYLPKDYTNNKKYPLHIAIHGGGENISFFKEYWNSKLLTEDYITLFVQSSRPVSSNGYTWTEDIALASKEILDSYKVILDGYSIDTDEITIGGFSEGGTMAIDMSLNSEIPIKGFVSLCPIKPTYLTKEAVKLMVSKNIKGIILTGENDNSLPQQKDMVDLFVENGFSHQFKIQKGLGHWFPENLPLQLDEALNYLK